VPDAVERIDHAHYARGIVDHSLEEREPLPRPNEGEQSRRRKAAPGQRGILDPSRRELVRVVGEALLPARQQAGCPQRHAVDDRVGRGRLAIEDPVDGCLGVLS
jgi:hypothetical protein